MIPLVLMGIGMASQMASQYAGNIAQAAQERINQKFYDEQANYARLSQLRASALNEFDYTAKLSNQASSYAASGVDSSGSAAITMAGTIKNYIDESFAIVTKGDLDVRLARLRGNFAGERADTLSSSGYNLAQMGTTALNGYTNSEGFGKGFPSFLSPGKGPPSGAGKDLKYFPPAKGE